MGIAFAVSPNPSPQSLPPKAFPMGHVQIDSMSHGWPIKAGGQLLLETIDHRVSRSHDRRLSFTITNCYSRKEAMRALSM